MKEIESCLNPSEDNLTKLKLDGDGLIEGIILDKLGFTSLEEAVNIRDGSSLSTRQIPLSTVKDIIAIDTLDTNISNKLKLLGYSFWHHRLDCAFSNYDLVKRFLPEGLIRIDDSRDDVLNSDELIELYEKAEEVGELTDQIINPSQNYIKRLKIGSGLVLELIDFRLEREEILGLKNKINKIISKRISSDYYEFEDEKLNETELLGSLGFYPKEIAVFLNIPKYKSDRYLSALYLEGRLTPKKGYVRKNNELKKLAIRVESLRNDPTRYYSTTEIAGKLQISQPRVVYLLGLLSILGRINTRGRNEAAQKRWNTDVSRGQVEEAINLFTFRYPDTLINYYKINEILKELFPDESFTVDVIQRRHYELMQNKNVPPTKHNAGKRARNRLKYLFSSEPSVPISLIGESKNSMSSYVTFKREYARAKREGYAPPLKVNS